MKPASTSERNETKTPDTFDLTEKVGYDDFLQASLPEEIIFPEELNRFLRDQIRDLSSENGCLRRALEECEEKLQSHIRKANSQVTLSSGLAGEIAASKIVELSKKCREQTAEVEVLKTRCKTLESKLAENEKEPRKNSENLEVVRRTSRSDSRSDEIKRPLTIEEEMKNREEQIKTLQDKLQQVSSKLYESKNTCTSLRQELNKAQKLLCSEVGENVTISSLSSHQSGWRGRAEQIQQLHQRIAELQMKLSESDGTCRGTASGTTTTSTADKRQITNLRNMEKERRQRAEESARELRQMSVALEASRRKQDAAKARIKVLENDLTNAKQSVALLNEKRSHDDHLIQALNGRLKTVEDKFRERERETLVAKERAENECVKMSDEVKRLQASNEHLRRIIDERETEIDALRNESGCKGDGKFLPLSRGSKSISPAGTSRSRTNGDYNEYVTLGLAAEAERERLMELVAVLNRRLDEERFATDGIAETLRMERSKLARLETKLQRMELDRFGLSKVNSGYKPRSLKSSTISGGSREEIANDETRFKMELLEEECLALKTRLATVQRDKAADLATYKQMLDQARKTFQDAYRFIPSI
ncbi:coiled-coil domain-containing protein 13 [Neodiprion fabricii]|uniref:coiled-coil domain-containing protein 13 n=1 Tax=Neodiprion fabricii TaxID=2872261 RepID=UPI001ED94822|nr:coiled-coil domain-containing protein 13 [Neodiprion fabricii]